MRKRFFNILFWSVLSAAFIGPGTITTAASSGAGFGFTLLWALVFSTIACVVLQEAGARLTIASGQNLGQAIRNRFNTSVFAKSVSYLVLISILLGCTAYEAGNILGAVAGASLILKTSTVTLTLLIGILAFVLLWFGSSTMIAHTMGIIVAVMGVCFLSTAFIMRPSWGDILSGAFVPRLPAGSELLVIGLIGTTVVPYNLFLGSGIKHNQSLGEMRMSLSIAIILGGIVSVAVLIVGTSITGNFTYEGLAGALEATLGGWAAAFFGIALFAAGLSSALTAPLAASYTAQSMLDRHSDNSKKWEEKGPAFRLVWLVVLLTGITFGILQVQPIPAIILAQALNGIILPLVSVFLLLMVNDASRLDKKTINSPAYNGLMGAIVFITLLVGLTNLVKALARSMDASLINTQYIFIASVILSCLISWPVVKTILRYRRI